MKWSKRLFYGEKASKRDLFKNFFKREQYNILILGLAISRYEANELIRDMVDEVYKNTSSFDYQKYFERE